MTYRTQNYQESLRSIRSLFLLLAVITMPAFIIVPAVALSQGGHGLWVVALLLVSVVFTIVLLPWEYSRGFRNLTFTLDDNGLTVRFLKTLRLRWADILSVEKVPTSIVGMRLCGLGWTVTHGLFSTKMGRVWLWLAGEKEAIFLKTQRRNYLFSPERIDEFLAFCQSKIGQ